MHQSTGYAQVITYDKEAERKVSVKYEDIVGADDNFEKIIRTEVRIKNRKLNYYKCNHDWGLAKELSNYLDPGMKAYFFKQYAEKVWFSEDFYRIDVALDMIEKDVNLSSKMKKKLCKVLQKINTCGYSEAQKYYGRLKRKNQIQKASSRGASKNYIKSLKQKKLGYLDFGTFSSYINQIRKLGINPLTFDEHFTLEKLSNFAKYKGEN